MLVFRLLFPVLAPITLTACGRGAAPGIQSPRQIEPLSIIALICFAFVVIGLTLVCVAVIGKWFELASGHLRLVNIDRFKKSVMWLLGVIVMIIFISPGVAISALLMQPMPESNSEGFTLFPDFTTKDTPVASPITQSQPTPTTIATPSLTLAPTPPPPTSTPTQHSIFIPFIMNAATDATQARQKPEEVVQQFFQRLNAKQYEQAYDLLSQRYTTVFSREDFVSDYSKSSPEFIGSEIQITSVQEWPNKVSVTGIIIDYTSINEEGNEIQHERRIETIELVRENGVWKINDFINHGPA